MYAARTGTNYLITDNYNDAWNLITRPLWRLTCHRSTALYGPSFLVEYHHIYDIYHKVMRCYQPNYMKSYGRFTEKNNPTP